LCVIFSGVDRRFRVYRNELVLSVQAGKTTAPAVRAVPVRGLPYAGRESLVAAVGAFRQCAGMRVRRFYENRAPPRQVVLIGFLIASWAAKSRRLRTVLAD
jgi:hypothetical protein